MSLQFMYNMFMCRQKLEKRARYRKSRSAYCCLSLKCFTHSCGVGVGHDQEYPCVLGVTDPTLAAVDDIVVPLLDRLRLEGERVRPRLRLRQTEGSHLNKDARDLKTSLNIQWNPVYKPHPIISRTMALKYYFCTHLF